MKKPRLALLVLSAATLLAGTITPSKTKKEQITKYTPALKMKASNNGYTYHLDEKREYIDLAPDKYEGQKSIHGNPLTRSNYSHEDNNDSFHDATSLFSIGMDEMLDPDFHHLAIKATISQKTMGLGGRPYIDKDFYSYDVPKKGTLSFDLTDVPIECDYDLRVFRLSDEWNARDYNLNFHYPLLQSQNQALGGSERISLNVVPGTYYAVIHSYQDRHFDNHKDYTLSATYEVQPQSDYSISKGRKQGDSFVLWESDYKPFGIRPIESNDHQSRIEYNNYADHPYIEHLSQTYTNGRSCDYAALYVWDPKIKNKLLHYYQSLLRALESQFRSPDGRPKFFQIDEEAVFDAKINAGSLVVTALSPLTSANLAASAAIKLGTDLLGFGFSFYQFISSFSRKKVVSTQANYHDALLNLCSALEDGGKIYNQEVIMIPSQYRFCIINGKHFLEMTPGFDSSRKNFYNQDIVGRDSEHSPFSGCTRGFRYDASLDLDLGVC